MLIPLSLGYSHSGMCHDNRNLTLSSCVVMTEMRHHRQCRDINIKAFPISRYYKEQKPYIRKDQSLLPLF